MRVPNGRWWYDSGESTSEEVAPGLKLKLSGRVLVSICRRDHQVEGTIHDDQRRFNGSLRRCRMIAPVRGAGRISQHPVSPLHRLSSKVMRSGSPKVGEGTAVNWPVGAGNRAMECRCLRRTAAPTPLVTLEFAPLCQSRGTELAYAQMQNAGGAFVSPDGFAAFKEAAAAAGAGWARVSCQILTSQPGRAARPIAVPR